MAWLFLIGAILFEVAGTLASASKVIATGQCNIYVSETTKQWPHQVHRCTNAICKFKWRNWRDGARVANNEMLSHFTGARRLHFNL